MEITAIVDSFPVEIRRRMRDAAIRLAEVYNAGNPYGQRQIEPRRIDQNVIEVAFPQARKPARRAPRKPRPAETEPG